MIRFVFPVKTGGLWKCPCGKSAVLKSISIPACAGMTNNIIYYTGLTVEKCFKNQSNLHKSERKK